MAPYSYVFVISMVCLTGSNLSPETTQESRQRLEHWLGFAEKMGDGNFAVKCVLECKRASEEKDLFTADGKQSMVILRQRVASAHMPKRVAILKPEYCAEIIKNGNAWELVYLSLSDEADYTSKCETLVGGNYFDAYALCAELRRRFWAGDCTVAVLPNREVNGKVILAVRVSVKKLPARPGAGLRLKSVEAWFEKTGHVWPDRIFVEDVDGRISTFFFHVAGSGPDEFPAGLTVKPGRIDSPVLGDGDEDVKYAFNRIPFDSNMFLLSDFGLPEPFPPKNKARRVWLTVAFVMVAIALLGCLAFRRKS